MKKFLVVVFPLVAFSLLFISCIVDVPGHTHKFSTEWTSDETYHWHAAVCNDTDEVSGKEEHSFDNWTVTKEATEEETGLKERECTVCKYKETKEIEKLAHTHKFSTEWSSDETNHWHECSGCDEKGDQANHEWDDGEVTTEPTAEKDGERTFKCKTCGKTKTEVIANLSHVHDYSEEWTSDETQHWHKCSGCDEKGSLANHEWDDGKVTTEATCMAEGVKTFTCKICSATKTEKIEKIEHTYSEKYSSDEDGHWKVCTVTDCDGKSAVEDHKFGDWITTTEPSEENEGLKKRTCSVCGYVEEITLAKVHVHKFSEEWTSNKTYHWHAATCGHTDVISEKAEHTFEETASSGKRKTQKCTVCGYEAVIYDDVNPTVGSTASASQDYIFNTDSVGFTTITIRRSEWNKMLTYFDYFYKNENNVIAESYKYVKDGQEWELEGVGLRLRGNTSRFRPQGKDTATDETGHTQANESWSSDYYSYAASCPDTDYRQSHFKIDFEPYDEDDRKMSDCMKGVALKRCDSLFTREIFCYDLFHRYGIWTAPRASQTKVYIDFVEDVENDGSVKDDITDCEINRIDFGVYEMFEEVNKQSLKGRMKKDGNNSAENAWLTNEGDLWKCSGGDLTANSNTAANFGCEQVEILNADKDKSQWSFVWKSPCYDLKTNKSDVDKASKKFQKFLTELNNLSDTTAGTTKGTAARKDFYEKWFDVDFFIKTYAVNILCGMDDDYWGNANNYYLYFDNSNNGSGKCYFIPFDYDNTLGCSITGDKVVTNPFEWGNGKNRPLLDRLLEVPEYKQKMVDTLLEVSSQDADSPWNKDVCFALWNKWTSQVNDYVGSPDIAGHHIGVTTISDSGGWKAQKHYLTQDTDNIYEQVTNNINNWFRLIGRELNFDLNGGTLDGESGVITKKYSGESSLGDIVYETPVRSGYEFVGWTKTKDGSDYTDSFTGEDDFTVYASWVDVSSYGTDLSIIEVPDFTYEGIKILIVNLPENNYRRTFYLNGKEIGGDDCKGKYDKIWAYPFVNKNEEYELYVVYKDEDYHTLATSNKLTITAASGKGEFKLTNTPEYYIENNILKWKTEPIIQIGDGVSPKNSDNWDEYYLLQVNSNTVKTVKTVDGKETEVDESSWVYQSWNWLGSSCNKGFNFKEHVDEKVLAGTQKDLNFHLSYEYKSSTYGNYTLIIFEYGDGANFNIE